MRTQGVRVAGAKPVNLIEILYPSKTYPFNPNIGRVYSLGDTKPKKTAVNTPAKPKRVRKSVALKYQFPPDKLICSCCKIKRPAKAFHANKSRASGRDAICGVCISEKRRARRKAKAVQIKGANNE